MFGIKINFEKSIEILKSSDELINLIADLNCFKTWSPWLCLDDNSKIEIQGSPMTVGHSQYWDSEFIGSGKMTLSKLSNNQIDFDLDFFMPFKYSSKIWFRIENKNDKTYLFWGMDAKLPLYMYLFRNMIKAYIGNDFERGLNRFKELAETGKIECTLSEVIKVEQSELYYIGEHYQCNFSELKTKMNQSYDRIMKDIETRKIPIPNGFASIYHKVDPIKGFCDVTTSVFYYQKENDVPGYENKVLPKHNALRVNLSGPYVHLPSAWGKISVFQRAKKFDLNKPVPMYEIYHNSPKMVEAKDVLTEIRLPVH